MSQVRTRFGLFSLLYTRCLARFEAISVRFSDFPTPDINSKGQWSYCATRLYFLLIAAGNKTCHHGPSTTTSFTNYRFSFCKIQIFIF